MTYNAGKHLCIILTPKHTNKRCLGVFLFTKGKHMNEEELKALEEELKKREEDLNEREASIKEHEEELNEHKEDAQALVKQIKDEYESKISKQRISYEKRLKEREDVIKQLLCSDGNANKPNENIIIDKINARRIAQNKKW